MIVDGGKDRLELANIYLKNTISEIETIPCECTVYDYCWRCALIDNLKYQYKGIERKIENFK